MKSVIDLVYDRDEGMIGDVQSQCSLYYTENYRKVYKGTSHPISFSMRVRFAIMKQVINEIS